MAVMALEVKTRCPFADGAGFGEVGTYEIVEGTVYFGVAPENPANALITDLGLAPRDENGLVRCSSDFRIIKPTEPQRGNRRILLDVVNRGRGVTLRTFNSATTGLEAGAPLDPGNGFLMRRGYTVVQCGWQHDLPPGRGVFRIEAPEATGPDGPLSGKTVFVFQPNAPGQVQPLTEQQYRQSAYLPNDVNDPEAVLTVQDYEDDPPQTVPRDRWSFARLADGRVVPDVSSIYMASGFIPGKVYHLVYSVTGPKVAGMGLLAVRDIVSFLRYGTARQGNPCADTVEHAYGFGASQTGRFLRLFLYLGLNLDERGRLVLDGLIPHIAGGRRAEFNRRFAQMGNLSKRTVSYLFPFTDAEQTDPGTGRTDGLLSRQKAKGGVPRVFLTNTSAEYYGSLGSLVHTDVEGRRDTVPSRSVRIYHFSGTHHSAGSLPLVDNAGPGGTRWQQYGNIVDYRPLLRAALVNLDRWVTFGDAPPPSHHPRIGSGTLVPPQRIAATFRVIPGMNFPSHLRPLVSSDYAPGMEEGRENGTAPAPPLEVGTAFTNLVPAVDEDGNELGGIRLPDICVPLATHTGWNLRHPEIGGAGQLIGLTGSTIPFLATRADREARGDPRRSIEERYGSKEEYLGRVRKAARGLMKDRYLLEEDVETVVEQAAQRYDVLKNL